MIFEGFHPYILPFVPECPTQTVDHHLRQAAIEFCSRAHVWKERLDTLLADDSGATRFDLALDDQVEMAKLYTVVFGTGTSREEAVIVEQLHGEQCTRDGTSARLAWTDNRRRIFLSWAPDAGTEIDVTVALKPAMTAFDFPDQIFAHHADDIANGALARLLVLPNQTWTNPSLAAMCGEKFTDAIHSGARHAAGGFARRTPRSKSTRFF